MVGITPKSAFYVLGEIGTDISPHAETFAAQVRDQQAGRKDRAKGLQPGSAADLKEINR